MTTFFSKIALSLFIATVVLQACSSSDTTPKPVVVTPPSTSTTFMTDIQPLIQKNCSNCHVTGGTRPTNYTDYATAKAAITEILDRVQRPRGTVGAMPQGRDFISAADLALLKKWQTDGLKEK